MNTAPPRKHYDLSEPDHDYLHWVGEPKRTVVICTHPRSGSTLLGEALHFAGDLGCPLEYFHRGFRPSLEKQWGVSGIESLSRTVHQRRTAPNGTLAIKLFWQDVEEIVHELQPDRLQPLNLDSRQASPATYLDIRNLLAPLIPNPIFVYLKRSDVVRQAVSGVTATQSGRWRVIPGIDEKAWRQKPEYSFEQIKKMVNFSHYSRNHWERFFEATGIQPHRLTYEQLDRDYSDSLESLFRYLGSASAVPEKRMQRQSDTSTEAFVLRFLQDAQSSK